MAEEQLIATAMFTCNPGDYADLEFILYFTTGAAGQFTLELGGIALIDVTDIYQASA